MPVLLVGATAAVVALGTIVAAALAATPMNKLRRVRSCMGLSRLPIELQKLPAGVPAPTLAEFMG
jgi:hypothetical protein